MVNQEMLSYGKQASVIRELFEQAKREKKLIGEENVFDFSIGNPSIPTPEKVNQTLIDLLQKEDSVLLHGYTSSAGDLTSREAIATYLNQKYQANLSGNHIYMTVGAAASLTICFHALIEEGEEILCFAPYFPEYSVFAKKAKAIFKTVKCDKDFFPDVQDLEAKITEKTKIVLYNSPNNPTGAVYPKDRLEKIAALLEKKQKEYHHEIYLISDEPYRELIYTSTPYPFITTIYDNSLVCYSFSKSLSLPGERIGYIAMSEKMKDVDDVFAAICGAGRNLGFICAPSLFQKLIPSVLGITTDISLYQENRDLLCSILSQLGYEYVKPDGAFYLFLKALEEDSLSFSKIATKFHLYLVPSDSFGCKGYVRVAYCTKKETIQRSKDAFRQLKEYYDEVKK